MEGKQAKRGTWCDLQGWPVQVARRVRAQEQVSEGEHTSGKRRAVRYQTCTREGFVYLHPRSSLHSTAPEFVMYTQLISTAKRPYMAGWIPACHKKSEPFF